MNFGYFNYNCFYKSFPSVILILLVVYRSQASPFHNNTGITVQNLKVHYVPLFFRDSKIAASERVKSGVTGEQLWLKINEPTEKDKGKYTMDIFDGKDGVKRVFDLSGQGE